MASPTRRFYPLTIHIDPSALKALKLMAPGPRRMGAVVSSLILEEASRREERAKHPARYAAALAADDV